MTQLYTFFCSLRVVECIQVNLYFFLFYYLRIFTWKIKNLLSSILKQVRNS